MSPKDPSHDELEAAGIDPDDGGFHEDADAANPHDDVDGRDGPGAHLLRGGDAGAAFDEERPSGVRLKAANSLPLVDPPVSWTNDLRVREVGIFLVKPEGVQRWRCFNRLTQIEHVTYGEEKEVDGLLEAQTAGWKRRLSGVKVKGAAWRKTGHTTRS